jgi:hypothetical protein
MSNAFVLVLVVEVMLMEEEKEKEIKHDLSLGLSWEVKVLTWEKL